MSAKTLKIKIKMPSRDDDDTVSPRLRRKIPTRIDHRTRATRPKRRLARAPIILTTLLVIGIGFYLITRNEPSLLPDEPAEFAATTSETLQAPKDTAGVTSLAASENNALQDASAELITPPLTGEVATELAVTPEESTPSESTFNEETFSIAQTLPPEKNAGESEVTQAEQSEVPSPLVVATEIEKSESEITAETAPSIPSSSLPQPLIESKQQMKTDSLTLQHNVLRAQFTNGVVNREPIDLIEGVVNANENNVVRLFYYTELRNLQGHTITHRWEHEGKMMATITFKVGGNRWRAYSSKFLTPDLTGNWRVVVNDAQEGTIKVSEFVLR